MLVEVVVQAALVALEQVAVYQWVPMALVGLAYQIPLQVPQLTTQVAVVVLVIS